MRSPCTNRGFLRLPLRLSAIFPSAEDPTESSKDMLTRSSVFRAKAAAACGKEHLRPVFRGYDAVFRDTADCFDWGKMIHIPHFPERNAESGELRFKPFRIPFQIRTEPVGKGRPQKEPDEPVFFH